MPLLRLRLATMRSGLLALALIGAAPMAGAQQQSSAPTVVGVVVDSASGAPIAGVEVSLAGARGMTDGAGAFRLHVARTDADTLRIRRLGFRARAIRLTDAAQVRVTLAAIPQQLSPVVVEAHWGGYTGRLAGYYERQERRTTGQFITRADLDDERTGLLTNVLQRMPGVSVRRGSGAPQLSLRGRNCRPLVWLDGVAMPSGDVDLDSFSPSSLHGVELYLGANSPPMRFQALRGRSECGTVVLWSRGPDTDPVGRDESDPAALERLIAERMVYTADEVDQVATVQGSPVVVEYPQQLKAIDVTGIVTVEFIVDAQGTMEVGSFGVVSTPHPRFAPAIRDAVQGARYTPAMRGGRPVRQLVRQRFAFGDPR